MNALEQVAEKAVLADQFITVPETTLPSGLVVPSFQVSQYACTQGADGKAASIATDEPWVDINRAEVLEACEKAGYKLITETQWLAIAWNVSQQDCNWTGGKVGKGELFQGIRNWNVESAMPGSYEPDDESERRWLTLSNGERICDLNGNVFQHVFDDIQGDENGLTTIIQTDSPSLTTAPFPSMEKGMGWRPTPPANWSGFALIRGGCWDSGSYAGVFYLLNDWPDRRNGCVGFRCTK
jgi:formylglycine-generating enzyme required for sulfatase activity